MKPTKSDIYFFSRHLPVWLIFAALFLPRPAAAQAKPAPIRIARLATLTHAPALVAQQQRAFEKALGNVPVEWKVFSGGPAIVEALFARAVDVAYVGPSPAINAWVRSRGKAIHILAGACAGGAAMVVQPHLARARKEDLKNKRFASVQTGNTQDVALRLWLKKQGYLPNLMVRTLEGPDMMAAFGTKYLDGAWVVEPWVSRLTQQAGGKVLFEESAHWSGGVYPTTLLVATQEFIRRRPRSTRTLVSTHVRTIRWIKTHPQAAQQRTNRQLALDTGKPLSAEIFNSAWKRLSFTFQPMAAAVTRNAADAAALGFLGRHPYPLKGIFDLRWLNAVTQKTQKNITGQKRKTP